MGILILLFILAKIWQLQPRVDTCDYTQGNTCKTPLITYVKVHT